MHIRTHYADATQSKHENNTTINVVNFTVTVSKLI